MCENCYPHKNEQREIVFEPEQIPVVDDIAVIIGTFNPVTDTSRKIILDSLKEYNRVLVFICDDSKEEDIVFLEKSERELLLQKALFKSDFDKIEICFIGNCEDEEFSDELESMIDIMTSLDDIVTIVLDNADVEIACAISEHIYEIYNFDIVQSKDSYTTKNIRTWLSSIKIFGDVEYVAKETTNSHVKVDLLRSLRNILPYDVYTYLMDYIGYDLRTRIYMGEPIIKHGMTRQ